MTEEEKEKERKVLEKNGRKFRWWKSKRGREEECTERNEEMVESSKDGKAREGEWKRL